MTGELAQIINLITNYNSGKIGTDLYDKNSTYQYCNSLNFIGFKKKFWRGYKEFEIATSITDWFLYLKKSNCEKLHLAFQSDNSKDSDHKLAGLVGGGGNWFIESKKSNFSDFWQPRWEVKPNKNDSDNRIWDVTYGLIISDSKSSNHINYNVQKQKEKLKEILIDIANFAVSNKNTKGWEKTFNEAKDSLTSESPKLGYYKDLVPENSLPKENLQLLISASKSFVFGGMGSWNDIGWFDDKKITKAYDELSEKLYRIMTESMIVAINKQ